jgi:phosphomevalonate kinase
MSPRASAPGKLFLSGEYAVLEGAPAVVTAVDRRATAFVVERPPPRSPVLDAVARAVRRYLAQRTDTETALPPVRAASDSFAERRQKLGLGSSAAVAAAACGALFEWAGLSIETHREQIFEIARAAHAEAQGGEGSGADVAAAVLGGSMIYAMDNPAIPIAISGLETVFVWTGRSASTVELLGQIRALEAHDQARYRDHIDAMVEQALAIADAYRRGEPQQIVELTARYGDQMSRLGKAAGAPIVTPEHAAVAELARDCEGGAKPSGAGGGDVAMAAFHSAGSATMFRELCHKRGLRVLDLSLGAPGLRAGS